MKFSVVIDGERRVVTTRAGLRNVSRALVGAVVEAGASDLIGTAHEAAVRMADGLSGYAATIGGRERLRVALLD